METRCMSNSIRSERQMVNLSPYVCFERILSDQMPGGPPIENSGFNAPLAESDLSRFCKTHTRYLFERSGSVWVGGHVDLCREVTASTHKKGPTVLVFCCWQDPGFFNQAVAALVAK